MNAKHITVTGPFTHENLSIFLLRGSDTLDGSRFIPLDQALEQKFVTVHETGTVGQLEVENLSDSFDLYIQAGDVVKGGRQDRTLGVDFVLPAKSGRVPIPSFCVESGRWHRRAEEDAGSFSSAKSSLSNKSLRMAAKMSKCQGEVWAKVAEAQDKLSESLDKNIKACASPSSYLLSVEDDDLLKRKEAYRAALAKIIDDAPDAVGYAFAINGEINTADSYGSGILFRKLWSKLLDAAVLEAISESRRNTKKKTAPVTADSITQWFGEADLSQIFERNEVPPRVRVDTRRTEKTFVFDTCDHAFNDVVLHKNLVMN